MWSSPLRVPKRLPHSTNPDHPLPRQPSSTNLPPVRVASRYAPTGLGLREIPGFDGTEARSSGRGEVRH